MFARSFVRILGAVTVLSALLIVVIAAFVATSMSRPQPVSAAPGQSLTITDVAPATTTTGATISYTITVTSTGIAPVNGVVVSQNLPYDRLGLEGLVGLVASWSGGSPLSSGLCSASDSSPTVCPGVNLAASDGSTGGPDTLVVTVTGHVTGCGIIDTTAFAAAPGLTTVSVQPEVYVPCTHLVLEKLVTPPDGTQFPLVEDTGCHYQPLFYGSAERCDVPVPGTYHIHEGGIAGYYLSYHACQGQIQPYGTQSDFTYDATGLTIVLRGPDSVNCNFYNQKTTPPPGGGAPHRLPSPRPALPRSTWAARLPTRSR